MKVLIACEESQEVCKAFRALGHEAYSCDIQEPSGGHPEWHILGDALKAIEGGQVTTMDGETHDIGRWDLPYLVETNVVEPKGLWVGSTSGRDGCTGRIKTGYMLSPHRDAKTRAKTFPGIASAMAEQWGGDIREEL